MLNRSNFLIHTLCDKGDEAPPARKGVYVTPSGTQAGNGNVVVICTSETQEPDAQMSFDDAEGVVPADHWTPFILDAESAKTLGKTLPRKRSDTAEANVAVVDATTEVTDRAMLSVNALTKQSIFRARKINAEYPNIENMFPERSAAKAVIALTPAILLDVAKVLNQFADAHNVDHCEISYYGPYAPIRLDVVADAQSIRFLMAQRRLRASETEA